MGDPSGHTHARRLFLKHGSRLLPFILFGNRPVAAASSAGRHTPQDGLARSQVSDRDGWKPASSLTSGPAPLDLNQATRAEIESARGVGVEMADRILEARAHRAFEDWADFRRRVKRVNARTLAGLHEAGFTLARQAPPLP